MVKLLSTNDHALIQKALTQAEGKTSAKISVEARASSPGYQHYVLIYALILGSLGALVAWSWYGVRQIQWLLTIQLATIIFCDALPAVAQALIRLVPRRVRHHFAARAAMHEYYARLAHEPKDAAFVLLFVSLAERYVHVVTNPIVHHRIPGDWHKITDRFAESAQRAGLGAACTEAVEQIADTLAPHFPA